MDVTEPVPADETPAIEEPVDHPIAAAVDRFNTFFERGVFGGLLIIIAVIFLGAVLAGTGQQEWAGRVATAGVICALIWIIIALAIGFLAVRRAMADDGELVRQRRLSGPDMFTLAVFSLYTVYTSTAHGPWQDGQTRAALVILAVPAVYVVINWALRGVHAYSSATRTLMNEGWQAGVIAAVGTPASLLSLLVAQDALVEVIGVESHAWSGLFRALTVVASAAVLVVLVRWRKRHP